MKLGIKSNKLPSGKFCIFNEIGPKSDKIARKPSIFDEIGLKSDKLPKGKFCTFNEFGPKSDKNARG